MAQGTLTSRQKLIQPSAQTIGLEFTRLRSAEEQERMTPNDTIA